MVVCIRRPACVDEMPCEAISGGARAATSSDKPWSLFWNGRCSCAKDGNANRFFINNICRSCHNYDGEGFVETGNGTILDGHCECLSGYIPNSSLDGCIVDN